MQVSLIIWLVLRYIADYTGFFYSVVPMVRGLYIETLSFCISKIGIFLNPTQPLLILIPQSRRFVRFHLDFYFRMLSVLFLRLIVSAIMYFRVRFYLRRW